MTVHPAYILAAEPLEPSKLKQFFENAEGTVIQTLENPGELRYAGWDLRTLDRARIVEGEYLEVKNGQRKTINLYEDGTLIFRASAGKDFLGHASPDVANQNTRINPIALVEVTLNFVLFYKKILAFFEKVPKFVKFRVGFSNAKYEGGNLYLVPGYIGSFAWDSNFENHPASKPEFSKEISFSPEDIIETPEKVAYRVLVLVYTWFGITSDQIPYVITDVDGERRIDASRITRSR